jgi:hypothetical protein
MVANDVNRGSCVNHVSRQSSFPPPPQWPRTVISRWHMMSLDSLRILVSVIVYFIFHFIFATYMVVQRKHYDANMLHVCIYALTWVQMDASIRVGTSISFFSIIFSLIWRIYLGNSWNYFVREKTATRWMIYPISLPPPDNTTRKLSTVVFFPGHVLIGVRFFLLRLIIDSCLSFIYILLSILAVVTCYRFQLFIVIWCVTVLL